MFRRVQPNRPWGYIGSIYNKVVRIQFSTSIKVKKALTSYFFQSNILGIKYFLHNSVNFPLAPNENKTGTSKVRAIPKAQKAQSFENMLRTFMKNSQKSSKHQKGAFRARKTLQKFGYSVHSAEKSKTGPFGFFDIHSASKYHKNWIEDPLETFKNFEKSLTVPKQIIRGALYSRSVLYVTLKKEKNERALSTTLDAFSLTWLSRTWPVQ